MPRYKSTRAGKGFFAMACAGRSMACQWLRSGVCDIKLDACCRDDPATCHQVLGAIQQPHDVGREKPHMHPVCAIQPQVSIAHLNMLCASEWRFACQPAQ